MNQILILGSTEELAAQLSLSTSKDPMKSPSSGMFDWKWRNHATSQHLRGIFTF